jgi:SAM-dependent methyltransferase
MNWKIKARIQNIVSLLPVSASYELYYWMQRRFGGLRRLNPTRRLNAGIETWKKIEEQDRSPIGKVFFEVGTGRAPIVPLAYWLMGAEKTVTIDLNPYMKGDLIWEVLTYLSEHREEISRLFGSLLDEARFDKLLQFHKDSGRTSDEFLDLCGIEYIAPGDASDTGLPENSIDFHTSFTVFEHIPENVLKNILAEGNRVIRHNGLFVHRIDYSDHFSHSDRGISAINFLQYSDDEWERYAGNRYMYMNRLCHDDYIGLAESVGQKILAVHTDIDKRAQDILRRGRIKIAEKFRSKPPEVLEIISAWLITEKSRD